MVVAISIKIRIYMWLLNVSVTDRPLFILVPYHEGDESKIQIAVCWSVNGKWNNIGYCFKGEMRELSS